MLPETFCDDPYSIYRELQRSDPVRRMPDDSLFITRHADLVAVYRDAATFGSDKCGEFAPKFGADTPLFQHHTTSHVSNDAPLHTDVRKLIVGALTVRHRQPAGRAASRACPLREWSLTILGALEPALSQQHMARGKQAGRAFIEYLRILVDRLDIGREPSRHLAFGLGINQCAGLTGFPRYELAGPPIGGGRARFRGFLLCR
jgi:cytochrome P450